MTSQRQTLRRLFPEHHQKVTAVRQELAQKRQELFDLIKVDATPWSAIQAKVQEISALQGSLEEEMARFMLEFKKNLNSRTARRFFEPGANPPGLWPGRGLRPRRAPARAPVWGAAWDAGWDPGEGPRGIPST